MFLNMTSVVYCRIFLHFMSSLINNLKKTNSESVSTPKSGVLNVDFALKFRIYRLLKSGICLKWILKKFSTTLRPQLNYLTQPVTPFKVQGYPQWMSLQRRLYVTITVCFLIFMISYNCKLLCKSFRNQLNDYFQGRQHHLSYFMDYWVVFTVSPFMGCLAASWIQAYLAKTILNQL